MRPIVSTMRFLFLRIPHSLKRRITYMKRRIFSKLIKQIDKNTVIEDIKPGDKVRVKDRRAVEATLDEWGSTRGCGFMQEMWQYCGTEKRVYKKVEQFLDERDYKLKRCKNIYLLEGCICNGTEGFGRCDRSCFYFWRAEWLEKI
jgi:hypothetical protein